MNRPGFRPEPPLRESGHHGRRRANESLRADQRYWVLASLESPDARIDDEGAVPWLLLLQVDSITRVSRSSNCRSVRAMSLDAGIG
jgi:hypothetical protein